MEAELVRLRAELEELKKVKHFYSYLKKRFKPPPASVLDPLEKEILRHVGSLELFYVPEALKANLFFKRLREKELVGIGAIYIRNRARRVAYLTLRGESTYEHVFGESSWQKFRVPREKLERFRDYYLEGFNFDNLASLLVGLAPLLAKRRLVYVAASDWRCLVQKLLALRIWLPEEILLYIRDLEGNRIKVYLPPPRSL